MVLNKLQLQNFGRFSTVTFTCKPCTVFCGKNESGKTTILDALFLTLLDKQTNSSIVQMLNNRYGSNFVVTIDPLILEKSLSLAELENFYVVRSSKIQIDFSSSANSGAIKSKLLETTLNIESLIEDITRDLGSRAKTSYGYKIAECNATKRRLEDDIKKNATNLESYTDNALLYKDNQMLIKKVNNELSDIKQKIETIDQKLASLKSQENNLATGLLLEKAQAWLRRAEEYTEKKQNYERMYGDLDPVHVEELLHTEASLRDAIENKKIENQKKEEKVKSFKYLNIKIKSLSAYSIISIIVGFLGLGLLFLGLTKKAFIALAFGFTCLLIAGVFILVRYLVRNSYKAEAQRILENDTIRDFKDAQRFAKLLEEEIAHSGLAECLEKQKAVQKQKEALLLTFNLPHELALRRFCAEKNEIGMELKTLYKTAMDTVPVNDFNAAGILIPYHNTVMHNEDDGTLLTLVDKIKHALNSLLQSRNTAGGDFAQLSRIRQEIEELETTKKRLEYEQKQVTYQKDTLLQKQTELVKLLAGFDAASTAHDEAVSKLQETMIELEKFTKESDALTIVLNILQAIAHTMKQELSFIENDLQQYFADIMPAFQHIVVSDVNPEKIEMLDIQNVKRPVNLLSQGTQDIFYLCFRMLLGSYLWEEGITADALPKATSAIRVKQKKRQKPGFFLWDEPFTALDTDRLKLAIAMLKKFQDFTGFQHIIFTKDDMVVNEITAQWSKDALIVHRL